MGTFGGGLSLYSNGKFKNFTTKNGLVNNKIRKLFLNKNILYIGTANGLSTINIYSKKIENINIQDKTTLVKNEKKNIEILGIIEANGKIIFNTHSHGVYVVENKTAKVLNKSLYTTFCLFKDNDDLIFTKNGFVENGEAIVKIKTDNLFSQVKPNFKKIGNCNTIFWDLEKINKDFIIGAANGVKNNSGGLFLIGKNIENLNKRFNIESNNLWDLYYDKKEETLYVGTIGEGLYIVNHKKNILYTKTEDVLDFKSNYHYKSVVLKKEELEINTNNRKYKVSKKELYTIVKKAIRKLPDNYTDLMDDYQSGFPISSFIFKSIKLIGDKIFLLTNYGLIKIEITSQNITETAYPLAIESYIFVNKNSLFFSFPYYSLFYIPNIDNLLIYKRYEDFVKEDYPKDIINIFTTKNNTFLIKRTGELFVVSGKDFNQLNFKLIDNSKAFEKSLLVSDSSVLLGAKDGNLYLLHNKKNNKIEIQKFLDSSEIFGNSLFGIEKYKEFLIIITDKGINICNLKTKKIILIDSEMGLDYKKVLSTSLFKNTLTLNTDNGFYDIDISQWTENNTKGNLHLFIKNLVVNETPINKVIKKLRYNENRVAIEFDTNHLQFTNKLLFRYKLIGLKNNFWSKWSTGNTALFSYLPSGNYNLIVQAKDLSTGEINIFNIKSFSIATPFWKNLYFLSFTGIILVISFIFYLRYKIKKVRKREQEIASYEKRIVETKLEALQSQMNPHFIFNSLNVIQNHIISNDVENSLIYVNNFSKLMRKTLEHSSKHFISINEELEFIKLYVSTQNIRFNHSVKFHYFISDDIEIDEPIIPPMLIQPLIENCFIHAFSQEFKNPIINLKISKNNNTLEISISDNGRKIVGDVKKHKSKALKLIEERLELLNEKNKLNIEKLYAGLKITIHLNKKSY